MLRRCARDKDFRQQVWNACSRDVTFFVNTFCWTLDPKSKRVRRAPFITQPCMDNLLLAFEDAVENQHDLPLIKSRQLMVSWAGMAFAAHQFLFRNHVTAFFSSRVEDDVDDPGNPKSLFWRFDWILKNLPGWLRPPTDERRLHRGNPLTGSTLDGSSTQENMGRGGVFTYMWFDEFAAVEAKIGHAALASSRNASPARIFVATPKGSATAHATIRKKSEFSMRLHWSEFWPKNRGLYTSAKNGHVEILDTTYTFPPDYEFICDGKLRSPYYDNECKRAGSPQEIAQEEDCDELGSGWQAFPAEVVDEHKAKYGRPALFVGDLTYDPVTLEPIRFVESPKGSLRLWIAPDATGTMVPASDYVVATDISVGTGASNSVHSIGDRRTGQKVGEYANPFIDPKDHAHLGIALCRWFKSAAGDGAFHIWENNGPGATYRKTVVASGYGRIYYARNESRADRKESDRPGWDPVAKYKATMLSEYLYAIKSGTFINPSAEAIEECRHYVHEPSGEWVHAGAASSLDPTGATNNHGDRVIADGLLCMAMGEKPAAAAEEDEIVPEWSRAWRREQRDQRRRESDMEGWGDSGDW